MDSYTLLYQGGIANVVHNAPTGRKRVMQNAYTPCEWFCHGLSEAGAIIDVAHWDKAGDAMSAVGEWQSGAGALFADLKAWKDA